MRWFFPMLLVCSSSWAELPEVIWDRTSNSIKLEAGAEIVYLPDGYLFDKFSKGRYQNPYIEFAVRGVVDQMERVDIELTQASLIELTNLIGAISSYTGGFEELPPLHIQGQPAFGYVMTSNISEIYDVYFYMFSFGNSALLLSGQSRDLLESVVEEILST